MTELITEPSREKKVVETGIYVRAKSWTDGKWGSFDIAELNKDSLREWLRSRGGVNLWAENVVAIMLGHEPWSE